MRFGPDYPARAPEVRFTSPLVHLNVNSNGKLCHTMFVVSPPFTRR
jgi:ubiquitin-protein ligase